MANEFISIKEVARTALPRLKEQLVFPQLIHRDFSSDFTADKGATIQVRKPPILTASEFDAASGVTAQDVKETSVEVTLDKIATVDVRISALEGATSFDNIQRLFIEPACIALAEKINSDGLALYKDIPYVAGTAGTTPSSLTDFSDAGKALDDNKAPSTPRYAIWNSAATAKFRTLEALVHADKSGSTAALRSGSIGDVYNLNNYMAQGIKNHTTGVTAATAVKVNGAVTAGATTLSIDGTTLVGKLTKGDVLTISGKHYTVTEDSADAASNAIEDVKVYPALLAVADNTDVTLIGSHTANLVFNPMAFAYVTRPLVQPKGVESYVTSYEGLSLRVVRGYDMTYKREMLSMDVLYGYKTMYPELAVRYLG